MQSLKEISTLSEWNLHHEDSNQHNEDQHHELSQPAKMTAKISESNQTSNAKTWEEKAIAIQFYNTKHAS